MESEVTPAHTVSFYGEDIVAYQGLDPNQRYVPVAQLCERLGLNQAAQERRIRAHPLLAQGARKLAVETDVGSKRMLCLAIDLLPLWLLTLDSGQVAAEVRSQLDLHQREAASVLWQGFRPQGFGVDDILLPDRHQQSPAEQAYVSALAMGTLARHQMMLERQLDAAQAQRQGQGTDPWATQALNDDPQAVLLAQTVRRVALAAAERSMRNEYGSIYSGLYRQFGISSYRRMPRGRLREALEWLERWHGDVLGEPEPPPDIE